MRRFLFAASLLCGIQATAQVTINSEDLPAPGDTIRYTTVLGPTIDDLFLDQTGEDQVWDYAWLEGEVQVVDSFLSVSEAPFLYQFFFNNDFLYPESYSNHATRIDDMEVGDFSLEDPFFFYMNDEDSYRQTGFGVTVSGIPFSVPYEGPECIFDLPMNYGDTNDCAFESDLNVPGVFTWMQSGERSNSVDGWGSVTTPLGTYEALRQTSVRQISDSTYIELLGFGLNLPRPDETVYYWVAEDMQAPVLEIITQDLFGFETVTSIRYQDDLTDVVPDNISEGVKANWSLYPNPATASVKLDGVMPGAQVQLVNLAGQVVAQTVLTGAGTLDLNGITAGMYQVVVTTGQDTQVQTLVVR